MRRYLLNFGAAFLLLLITVRVSTLGSTVQVHRETAVSLPTGPLTNNISHRTFAAATHLLITEFSVAPTVGEFIEIFNGTGQMIELHNYYLTDAITNNDNDYVNIVDSSYTALGTDFLARFPDDSRINHGDYLVIAIDGEGFYQTYGFFADFELKGTSDQSQDMVAPLSGSIGRSSGLSNAGECIILFYWDGETDLVSDIDYVVWGDLAEAMDKSNLQKDGPDPDQDPTTYKNDTPIGNQIPVSTDTPHASGASISRINFLEIDEVSDSGNGLTGHDESSERLNIAFTRTKPSPGKPAITDFINVTFNCNTCTWPDTLSKKGIIQLRGTIITDRGSDSDDATIDTLSPGIVLHWDAQSNMSLVNVEGDYWTGTFAVPRGEKLAYKFYICTSQAASNPNDPSTNGRLEFDLKTTSTSDCNNRILDLTSCASADTILPLQFLNGSKNDPLTQYQVPFIHLNDHIDLIFRVNMASCQDFDPLLHTVGIRGYHPDNLSSPDDFNWYRTKQLMAEPENFGENLFYRGHIQISTSSTESQLLLRVVMSYKNNDLSAPWFLMPYVSDVDYIIDIPESDSTIHWKWFDDRRPNRCTFTDKFVITVNTDMNSAIANNGFDHGDSLWIRFGYHNSANASELTSLRRVGNATHYSAVDTIYASSGTFLYYQYFRQKHGIRYREEYYNYQDETFPNTRRIALDNTNITINDLYADDLNPHRMPLFLNPGQINADSLNVVIQCDVRPAIYQLITGDTLYDADKKSKIVHPAEIFEQGIIINGPIVGVNLRPDSWGSHLANSPHHLMYDDGTHFDIIANDSIFTRYFTIYKDSLYRKHGPPNSIGQKLKFGIGGFDNESSLDIMHTVNIATDANPAILRCQFGSIDPQRFDSWDYILGSPVFTDINHSDTETCKSLQLFQNYPNPVNSSTSISFELNTTSHVSLKIYNLIGQEVNTLVDEDRRPGMYSEQWDCRDLSDKSVTSGIYIYRLKTDQSSSIRKMLVIK